MCLEPFGAFWIVTFGTCFCWTCCFSLSCLDLLELLGSFWISCFVQKWTCFSVFHMFKVFWEGVRVTLLRGTQGSLMKFIQGYKCVQLVRKPDREWHEQVVLLGESFGGLLSLAVALRLGREKLKGAATEPRIRMVRYLLPWHFHGLTRFNHQKWRCNQQRWRFSPEKKSGLTNKNGSIRCDGIDLDVKLIRPTIGIFWWDYLV